jgi:hypothetical protein
VSTTFLIIGFGSLTTNSHYVKISNLNLLKNMQTQINVDPTYVDPTLISHKYTKLQQAGVGFFARFNVVTW